MGIGITVISVKYIIQHRDVFRNPLYELYILHNETVQITHLSGNLFLHTNQQVIGVGMNGNTHFILF